MASNLSAASRKPANKQKKTYGKNVRSHISGWFGRDLWSAVEPANSIAKKTREQEKQKSKSNRRSVEEDAEVDVEKQLAREVEEEGLGRVATVDEDEKQKVKTRVKKSTDTTESAEVEVDLEIPGTPEHEELEAGILALLEGVKKIDVSASSSRAPTKRPSANGDDDWEAEGGKAPSSSVEEGEADRKSNYTKFLEENSDKENDEPHFSALGSRKASRKRSSDTSAQLSPREALKERSISPEGGPELEALVESPTRKNGVRKKGSNGHRISISSPIHSLLSREPVTPSRFPDGKAGGKEEKQEDIKVWEDLESGNATPVRPKQQVFLKGADNKSREKISVVEISDSEDELAQKLAKVKLAEVPKKEAPETTAISDSILIPGRPTTMDIEATPSNANNKETSVDEQGYISDDSELTTLEDLEEDCYPEDLPVEDLLHFCTIPKVLDFTEYIDNLLLQSTIRKLGEASYSEVFIQSHQSHPSIATSLPTVLKIIPFGGPGQCLLSSIIQEVSITQSMATINGFIGFRGAYVVRGAFPHKLMDEWDAYEEERGSENERPEFYDERQLFAIIMLEMGGTDLEHFNLNGWEEAGDVFWQAAIALAVGEREREFEHRDLHFGNIVIRRELDGQLKNGEDEDEVSQEPEKLISKLSINDDGGPLESNLKVSLIDYTLSRAICGTSELDSEIQFAPLDDPALFNGKGDYQFDIYRSMRTHISSGLVPPDEEDIDWNVYAPKTNVFWLHYLTNILLNKKGIPRPAARGRNAASEGEKKAYKDLEAIAKCIDPRKKRFGEKGEVNSAGELVEWAIGEGMLKVGVWGEDDE